MPGFDIEPETMRRSADELDVAKDEVQALLDDPGEGGRGRGDQREA